MKDSQGFVLVVALLVLMLLSLIVGAFIKSAGTANLVASGLTFKKAATYGGDVGINSAITQLTNQTNFEANIANVYFATQQAVDANGLPTTVNWASVPINQQQNYAVQYVIERLCTGALPVANFSSQCSLLSVPLQSSNKVGDPSYNSTNTVYYRVTSRITGPKNSLSYVQAILAK